MSNIFFLNTLYSSIFCFIFKNLFCLKFPELSEPLSNLNHKKKFHTLLYISEMDSRIDMGRYAMNRVKFVHRGEYLALEVAGLSEGRMSLLSGDLVYATSSWATSGMYST